MDIENADGVIHEHVAEAKFERGVLVEATKRRVEYTNFTYSYSSNTGDGVEVSKGWMTI
jgi:hypothetical protein